MSQRLGSAAVGVDAKTVNRWLTGRIPHRRTRLAVARILDDAETDLWPQARPDLQAGAPATAEVLGAYAHRADVPHELWTSLLLNATEKIDILGYAYLFVLELLPDAADIIGTKCRMGAQVRFVFADPDCSHVLEGDALLSGRIRNALNMLGPLAATIFRFDNQMIVTPISRAGSRLSAPGSASQAALSARYLRVVRRRGRTGLGDRHPLPARSCR